MFEIVRVICIANIEFHNMYSPIYELIMVHRVAVVISGRDGG